MITLLNDAPENVAAFNATGEINQQDLKNIIIPHVKSKLEKFDELNYLLYINSDVDQTDIAWLTVSLSKLGKKRKCNRAAIICDDAGIQKINTINTVRKFKIFKKSNLYHALFWCNNGKELGYANNNS